MTHTTTSARPRLLAWRILAPLLAAITLLLAIPSTLVPSASAAGFPVGEWGDYQDHTTWWGWMTVQDRYTICVDHLHVTVGDRVAVGQHIADVGSNGRSTGPHLHLEIRADNDPDQLQDSDRWLAQQGATPLTGPAVGASGCYTRGGRR